MVVVSSSASRASSSCSSSSSATRSHAHAATVATCGGTPSNTAVSTPNTVCVDPPAAAAAGAHRSSPSSGVRLREIERALGEDDERREERLRERREGREGAKRVRGVVVRVFFVVGVFFVGVFCVFFVAIKIVASRRREPAVVRGDARGAPREPREPRVGDAPRPLALGLERGEPSREAREGSARRDAAFVAVDGGAVPVRGLLAGRTRSSAASSTSETPRASWSAAGALPGPLAGAEARRAEGDDDDDDDDDAGGGGGGGRRGGRHPTPPPTHHAGTPPTTTTTTTTKATSPARRGIGRTARPPRARGRPPTPTPGGATSPARRGIGRTARAAAPPGRVRPTPRARAGTPPTPTPGPARRRASRSHDVRARRYVQRGRAGQSKMTDCTVRYDVSAFLEL